MKMTPEEIARIRQEHGWLMGPAPAKLTVAEVLRLLQTVDTLAQALSHIGSNTVNEWCDVCGNRIYDSDDWWAQHDPECALLFAYNLKEDQNQWKK